ncbi:MAG: NUDIX domain-containing protein [Proteobacteria bacterium]|nr:NUDIX domain-containing protein [Pseudomonadota bacterium]
MPSPAVVASRLARGIVVYAKIAWWGLVAPHTGGGKSLVVPQAVIRSDRGVLLCVRSDLWGWELPGGAPEPGETPEQAVVREVREETGLDVAIERHVGDYIRTGFRPHTAVIFACRVTGGTLGTSSENRAVAWFHPGELPETLFPWYRAPIEDAHREMSPVERHETWGLADITAAIQIDLRMRLTM